MLSPVLALAAVGVVSLARSGHRAEAAVVVGVAVCFLLYNAAYYLPFGGFAAGPRFLVPAVPFLAIGVAAAWRSSPVLTVTLFLASVVVATVSLIGNPQGESESAGSWFNRVERGDVTRTVFDWISGSHETVAVVPVVLLFAAAVAIGLAVTPRFRVDARVMGWRSLRSSRGESCIRERTSCSTSTLRPEAGPASRACSGWRLRFRSPS